MADVVVNIRANTSGLQDDLENAIPNGGGNAVGGGSAPVPPSNPISPTGGGNVPPTTPSAPTGGNLPAMPTYDRLAADIRREVLSRGAVMVPGSANYNQLMQTITQQQRTSAYQTADTRFAQRTTLNQQAYEHRKNAEMDELEDQRKKAIQAAEDRRNQELASAPTDNSRERVNDKWDKAIDKINKDFDTKKQETLDRLIIDRGLQDDQNKQEWEGERNQVEKDLAQIIKELTNELRQGNPNSYLGNLREKYKEAVWKRDNAESADEVRKYAQEASKIQAEIAKAQNPRGGLSGVMPYIGLATGLVNQGAQASRLYWQNQYTKIAEMNATANGDAFGAMEQDIQRKKQNNKSIWGIAGAVLGTIVGVAVAAFTGGSSLALTAAAVGGLGAGAALGYGAGSLHSDYLYGENEELAKFGRMWADQEKRMSAFTPLAMQTRGTGVWADKQTDINVLRNSLLVGLTENEAARTSAGNDIYDLGYNASQASQVISKYISKRGFIGKEKASIFGSALDASALEKVYNMSEGSLGQLSAYDRYSTYKNGKFTNHANQDMANLVASLDSMGTLGMSNGERLRANEFLNYQTQLMEMQKGWMNPNSKFAQRQLLAAQNAFGNNMDARAITEIGQMNNAITHPQEGYSKVLTYDVIQSLFPETKGNLLAIRQKQFSNDPEVRMKIQRAMFNKLTSVYGGVDTTSGYLALSQYTGIEDPDRLKAWVTQMKSGLPQVKQGSIAGDESGMENYTQEVSKELLKFQDSVLTEIQSHTSELVGVSKKMLKEFGEVMKNILDEIKD